MSVGDFQFLTKKFIQLLPTCFVLITRNLAEALIECSSQRPRSWRARSPRGEFHIPHSIREDSSGLCEAASQQCPQLLASSFNSKGRASTIKVEWRSQSVPVTSAHLWTCETTAVIWWTLSPGGGRWHYSCFLVFIVLKWINALTSRKIRKTMDRGNNRIVNLNKICYEIIGEICNNRIFLILLLQIHSYSSSSALSYRRLSVTGAIFALQAAAPSSSIMSNVPSVFT